MLGSPKTEPPAPEEMPFPVLSLALDMSQLQASSPLDGAGTFPWGRRGRTGGSVSAGKGWEILWKDTKSSDAQGDAVPTCFKGQILRPLPFGHVQPRPPQAQKYFESGCWK